MINLKIYPDAILKEKAKEVESVDDDIKSLVSELFNTMRKYGGVGLAAPQIGVSKRVCVIELNNQSYTLINPIILEKRGSMVSTEGCLSFPGVMLTHDRPEYIKVESLDFENNLVTYEVQGLYANIFSHEIDHLDGILFIDFLSNLKRDYIKRKMIKTKRKLGLK